MKTVVPQRFSTPHVPIWIFLENKLWRTFMYPDNKKAVASNYCFNEYMIMY